MHFRHCFLLSLIAAAVLAGASPDISGLPVEAVIVEMQPLPIPNRTLVLWMLHPSPHEDTIVDGVYTCPDQTMGHYFDGPTRVSLVDTAAKKVINTVPIRFDWGAVDHFFVPYRIAGFVYPVQPPPRETEAKPRLLSLHDFTGSGQKTQFALFDAQNCSILATTIYGFSRKRDTLIQYPFELKLVRDGETKSSVRYWMDHFASQKPIRPGYWKYSIDYNSGDRSTYEIRFDPDREAFTGTVVSVVIREEKQTPGKR